MGGIDKKSRWVTGEGKKTLLSTVSGETIGKGGRARREEDGKIIVSAEENFPTAVENKKIPPGVRGNSHGRQRRRLNESG